MALPPAVPAGQGGLSVIVTTPAGANFYVQAVHSSADSTRIFNAWQQKAGPRDQNGNAIGTVSQFTAYLGQMLLNHINAWITVNEQATVVPPTQTVGNG